MPPEVTFAAIEGFRLVTAAPERLAAFYRALGFHVGEPAPIAAAEMAVLGLHGGGARRSLSLGPSRVDLDVFERPGRGYPADAAACDRVFQHFALVTDDIEAAWRAARDAGATPISRGGPVRLPQSAGGATAIKFRDPEGHPLEFLQFAPGSAAGWSGAGNLGVDHSAISVADVAASERFYADRGLRRGERSLNRGPTQAALDALDDVEVDVVPMRPSTEPPHLELLGYRRPAAAPGAGPAANDVAATRIVWKSHHDALLRDPDGHLHQLTRRDPSPANRGT
jgi:catechol 2,3-dioxygenase-like lactoylglutathione lyase family enzyme